MPVIAVVNQKGGTGKTTISTTLDCAFAEHFQVLLLDADGQGSALDWADSRAQQMLGFEVKSVEPGRLLQDVRLWASDCHWVIIDGRAGHRPDHRRSRPHRRPGPDTGKARPLRRVGGVGYRGRGEGAPGTLPPGYRQPSAVGGEAAGRHVV